MITIRISKIEDLGISNKYILQWESTDQRHGDYFQFDSLWDLTMYVEEHFHDWVIKNG